MSALGCSSGGRIQDLVKNSRGPSSCYLLIPQPILCYLRNWQQCSSGGVYPDPSICLRIHLSSFPSSSLYASFLSVSLPPSLLLFPSFLPCFLLFSLLYSLPLSLPTCHFVILQKPFLTPTMCHARC